MNSELLNMITAIANAIAAIASVSAVIVAVRAAIFSSKQAGLMGEQLTASRTIFELEVHSRFQSEMRVIQRSFSHKVNDPDWSPNESERRSIRLYWYLVFDEWLTCNKLHPSIVHLWDSYYSIGVQSALKNAQFNLEAGELFKGESTFFNYGDEFFEEIDRLCKLATRKNLL